MMFWMGPRHTITGLHSDTEAMNVLHQMFGSKVDPTSRCGLIRSGQTVWMFPPSEVPNLYPSDKYDNGAVNYEVDPFNPDLQQYPRFLAIVWGLTDRVQVRWL